VNKNPYQDFDIKVNIHKFKGKMQPNKFIDWLQIVERVFYFKEYPDERKVKLMAIKLKKNMLSYDGRILRSKGFVRAEVRSSLRNR
jgi:hypothetical protein